MKNNQKYRLPILIQGRVAIGRCGRNAANRQRLVVNVMLCPRRAKSSPGRLPARASGAPVFPTYSKGTVTTSAGLSARDSAAPTRTPAVGTLPGAVPGTDRGTGMQREGRPPWAWPPKGHGHSPARSPFTAAADIKTL